MEITNTEKALNVWPLWRKNAQLVTPIMMPKISRYLRTSRCIEKVDIFFDDTIRYIDIENDISIFRYIE